MKNESQKKYTKTEKGKKALSKAQKKYDEENLEKEKKDSILEKLPPKDKFLLEEGLSYPEDSAA